MSSERFMGVTPEQWAQHPWNPRRNAREEMSPEELAKLSKENDDRFRRDWLRLRDERDRDRYALAALQIISAPIGGKFPAEMAAEIAQHAYRIADAMLAERAKRK